MQQGRSARIFDAVSLMGADFVSSSLGSVGDRIINLFKNLGTHPEADSFFFEDCDLGLCDLLHMAQYAEENKLHFFRRHIPLIADMQVSERFKKSAILGGGGSFARFLKKNLRKRARETRSIQEIKSNSFYDEMAKLWSSIPCNFDFNQESELIKNNRALEEFREMGCKNLIAATESLISRFYVSNSFFGYPQISIKDACMILAKRNGIKGKNPSFNPAVIPTCLLVLPKTAEKKINAAENCRGMLFDAVFDNYFAVVKDLNEFKVRGAISDAVVLGERDGKCYFICEWNPVN